MEEELERRDRSEEVKAAAIAKALEEGEEKGEADEEDEEEPFVTLEEMTDALSVHNVFEDSESDLTRWITKMTLNRLDDVMAEDAAKWDKKEDKKKEAKAK
eukprot:2462844-Ditylum_brightwellii.AAC.1